MKYYFNKTLMIHRVIVLTGFVLLASQTSFSQPKILFRGALGQHQGIAFWNADGSGPEPANFGHTIACIPGNQPYYFSTANYAGIDPQSAGGFAFDSIVSGFPNFANMMFLMGLSFSDIIVQWPLYSLGNDIEGEDWWLDGCVEIRKYKSAGDAIIFLEGESLVGWTVPTLTFIIDWDRESFSIESDPFQLEDRSGQSSSPVKEIARALLSDVEGRWLKIFKPEQPDRNIIPIVSDQGREGTIHATEDFFLEIIDPTLSTDNNIINKIPEAFVLYQNYPNPFNPTTTITFHLPKAAFVNLSIYNAAGQLVQQLLNEHRSPGVHSVHWTTGQLSSGIYLYRIQASDYSASRKALLIK